MSLGRSFLFALFPTLLFAFLFWKGMPMVDWLGKPLLYSYSVLYGFFCLQWMAFALWLFRREKHPEGSFRGRFRLKSMNGSAWVWCLGVAAFLIVSEKLLAFTVDWIRPDPVVPPKYFFRMMEPDPAQFMEVMLRGKWIVPVVFLATASFRILCEELWFRGYMFPRQEEMFGRRAWWIHGACWLLFLAVQPWELIRAFPGALLVSCAAYKQKSTSVTLIARMLATGPVFFRILQGVIA